MKACTAKVAIIRRVASEKRIDVTALREFKALFFDCAVDVEHRGLMRRVTWSLEGDT